MSVRKSHLQGRNHIRKYCEYYEQKAKQLGIWDMSENQYNIDIDYLYSKEHSLENFNREKLRKQESQNGRINDEDESLYLPPPSVAPGYPGLPPSVLRYAEEDQKAIAVHMARDAPSI